MVPYQVEVEDDATASLGADDVALRVAEALSSAFSIDASPIFTAYEAAMSGADADCPNYYDYDGSQYWYDECTSEAGVSFSGYAFYILYDEYESDGVVYDGAALYGVGATSADGEELSFGGSATWYQARPPGIDEDSPDWYLYTANQLQGGFSWSGEDAPDWLAAGQSPDLYALTAWMPSYDLRYVYIDGSIGASGGGVTVFDGLTLYSENVMTSCPNEPYGGMSVRDEQGEWYDVVFHGPAEFESEVDASLCDGCGDLYFHGALLGEVCADFSPLTDWEISPWS